MQTRSATQTDAAAMTELLNAIIAAGGTTAHLTLFKPETMQSHYINPPLGISCILAEKDGVLLGFQGLEWSDPDWQGDDPLPAGWAVIATFVSDQARGLGVGKALFAKTRAKARSAGVVAIDATIRADNVLGLAFYKSLGFETYQRLENIPLGAARHVDRIRKRLTP